ncbi:MAG: glycogen synthase GlgA [Pirellulales bacterium]|nr:glycogen synthase GlgA [Pirellulales bacterium]
MKILLATSEAVPFSKTGGLADVCGALPVELARLGHDPAVIVPAHRQSSCCGLPIEPLGIDFIVPIGSKTVTGHLLQSKLPEADVPVYLIQQDHYFEREGLYQADGKDYVDNCERFVFFSRAVLETIRLLDLQVDVIHANDWQTGLVPAYLKVEYRGIPRYEQIASLFTIHNLAYQGRFWHWDMLLTGLDWKYFNWRQMEFHGHLNLLKTGIVFADSINTVSPRYSQEIQNAALGCGLEGTLQHRRNVLSGILNGMDTFHWDPAADPNLAARYNATTVSEGKSICKAALQKELGLPVAAGVPLVAFIGRLCDQKGVDLIAKVMQTWAPDQEMQWGVLGTGDAAYHAQLTDLAKRFPRRVAVRLEFDAELAHRIEAGADMFLMPSRFEPCGLNQFYSLAYGTVPVVRATGGLADTVIDATEESIREKTATGFSFTEYSDLALAETLRRALDAYRRKDLWHQLIQTGMKQDWSWSRSAAEYARLYGKTVARRKEAVVS